MSRGTDSKKKTTKKTPAQREKEEKENRLAALDDIIKGKLRDEQNLDEAAHHMEVSDIEGIKVTHRKFGKGEIVSSEGKFFHADFPEAEKNLKMQFPDAFDKGILTVDNSADAEKIEDICERFRSIDSQKEDVSKRIYEISAEMSKISL